MAPTAGNPPGEMLTSWKQVARFFDRDTRTVQRWEKQEGLPVHRHPHQRQSSVYAFSHELETWWRERGSRLSDLPPPAPDLEPAEAEVPAELVAAPVEPVAVKVRAGRWMVPALLAIGVLATAIAVAFSAGGAGASPNARVLAMLDGERPQSGLAPGPIADLNGDGADDFVFSATTAGEMYVVFGGGPLPAGRLPSIANVVIRGSDNGLHFASSAQDFDGDGLRDLVVSVLLRDPDALTRTGPTYLLRGRRTWPAALTLPDAADVTFTFSLRQDVRLHACGSRHTADFSQDGIADLVLGASDYSPSGRPSAGGVFLLFGRRVWPKVVDVERDADVTIHGARSGEALTANCDTGEYNGDGRMDLALMASEDTLWSLLGGKGRYYLFFGREQWPARLDANDADFRVDALRPKASLIAPVVADVNGDGLDDLIMTSAQTSTEPPGGAEIAVFFGRPSLRAAVEPMSTADVLIHHGPATAKLGSGIIATDLDLDGADDLILAEPGAGRTHVLLGRHVWPARTSFEALHPLEIFQGEPGTGNGGISLGRGHDDSTPSVALAASDVAVGGRAGAGRAWLIRPHLPIRIDVRPESEPNILYLPGVVVVRVAGKDMAGDPIDHESVRAAGAAPRDVVWRDFDADGSPDLQLHFNTADMNVTTQTIRVRLTARTRRGILVAGDDAVVVMPGNRNRD